MNYQPMSRETHLARGTCCGNGCVHCPWYVPKVRPDVQTNIQITEALKSGETVTIYSDRMSIVPQVVLQDRVTVIYKSYQPS